ncbi:MAG: type II toxin-antitoxin system death-on-curing family toxin [Magnetovibrio sp.]|nr:type II toxin-antitoxin system death-on-curing family toxin [Magnetovibrio sp.]
MAWVWIDPHVVRAVHLEQIAEHGGAPGVRDEGLLASALSRPRNQAAYAKSDVAALAAAYGYGLARNHPFVPIDDGNKRTCLVAMELFLALNGFELRADDVTCVQTIMSLADGSLSEAELAAWLRQNISA